MAAGGGLPLEERRGWAADPAGADASRAGAGPGPASPGKNFNPGCLQARDYGKARVGVGLVGTAGLARVGCMGRARSPNGIIGHVGTCLCR